LTGHAVADLDPSSLDKLLADPDAPRSPRSDACVYKQSASSAVIELELQVAGQPRSVIYKRL